MKKTVITFILVFNFIIYQGLALGQNFNSKVDFLAGNGVYNIFIADLNGDNKTDIAAANLNTNSVSIFLNTTSPSDSIPNYSAKFDFTTGNNASSVASADFNLDGLNDLAIVASADNAVSVLLNNTVNGSSTVSFASQTSLTTGTLPYFIATGDFNLDGKPDIVITNSQNSSVSAYLNTTTPGAASISFSAKTDFTVGNSPQSINISDFNGDYLLDVAVANFSDNTISILLNNTIPGSSTINFLAKQDFTTGNGPTNIDASDINGDGKLDFAVVNKSANTFSILFNNTIAGSSTILLANKIDYQTGSTPTSVVLGEINGDGRVDAVVTNGADSSISVFLNNSVPGSFSTAFSTSKKFSTGSGPAFAVINDINRDGKLDIITANSASNTISAMFNNTFTFYENINWESKNDFAANGTTSAIATADFNGDGKPDIAVSNWDSSSVSVFLNLAETGSTMPKFSSSIAFHK